MHTAGKVVNVSGYLFVALDRLDELRDALKTKCDALGLTGTILLSKEGINCFVAGDRPSIDEFLNFLTAFDCFQNFEAKKSYNDYPPFNRMLVKIKKEIITFDMPEIQPAQRASQKIKPHELRALLDAGDDVVLLDTRNDYEVELGTFEQAKTLDIANFRDFPAAIEELPEEYKEKPVVMFCTGGIRCEKAGPFMEDAGFRNILQLDGGILKYFEECGGDHWRGECFVFDKRVALDPNLAETSTTLCYICQAVLTEADQRQPSYQFGVSCPHCFAEEENSGPTVLDRSERMKRLKAATTPLPGSIPYENFRPMSVSQEMDGLSLLDFLQALKTHVRESEWIEYVEAGQILHRGKPVGLDRRVCHGQKYYHILPETTEPDVATHIQILYEDSDLVVIDKPAPLPMHPCGRFNKNSLQSFFYEVYAPDRLRLVHRLDANTTGVVVYARSKPLATALQEQFGQGRVEKEYLAAVHGNVEAEFKSEKRIAARPGDGGIRHLDPAGQVAVTEFVRLASAGDQSLLKVFPKTGRTNQIRLHLWDLGFPIIGDPTYLKDRQLGVNQTLALSDPPMHLHAKRISFLHPQTKESLEFETADPPWLRVPIGTA